MRVAIFFMCLCFFLLRGESSIYAGTHYSSNGATLLLHPGQKDQVSFTYINRGSSVIKNTNPGAEQEYFINDDVEEEDTNNCSAQKYRLFARSHATHAYPSYPAILNYLCNCYKFVPSFCIPTSDKYILQGVLRI